MKIKKEGNIKRVWISSSETWRWANRINAKWPCSTLADKRIYMELDKHDNIVDIKINGRYSSKIDGHELRSCINDLLKDE